MKRFGIDDLNSRRSGQRKSYLEFLRERTLSAGLYVLRAGERDRQQPHDEDEVYYIVRGRARFRSDGEDCAVSGGSILFVPAGAPHDFHAIEDELHALVFFAPPEGTGKSA